MTEDERFEAEFGQTEHSRIWDVISFGTAYEDITMLDRYRRDAINEYGSLVYTAADGRKIVVNWEEGDRNGSMITEYGDIDPVKQTFTEAVYVIDAANIRRKTGSRDEYMKALRFVAKKFRAQLADIRKEQHAYNYDRTFAPGSVTEEHYKALRDKRGNLKVIFRTRTISITV